MFKAKEHSISRNLTWMNMLVSGSALLLACTAFIAYDMVTFRESMVRNLSTQAQIIGSNTVSAMLFDDASSAKNTLSALNAANNILSAGIYTPDGRLFASYSRDPGGEIPTHPPIPSGETEIHWLKNHEVVLVRSIVFQGKPTETVYIRSSVEELNQRLKRYAGIAVLVLLACLMAALLVSSIFRRAVAEPIVQLAKVARIVSRDKNYSVRAMPTRSRGELAILLDAFNEMLAQIQQSETALRKAHEGLEQRVQERTAELEAAKKEVEAFSFSVLRAKEEIERASKFKDQFLSTMSHELRTPMNAILGFSELLTDERYGPLNARQLRYVNHIRIGGQHLLKLINDILDLSKIEAGRLELTMENVDVETTVAEVLDVVRPLAEQKSQTLLHRVEDGAAVQGDATRFRQVLMNLLGNAIKFTPEGGSIEMSARRLEGNIRTEVRDSGPGIPAEEQMRIFEAFHRLQQSGQAPEGTGLGLAITKRLIELQGGQLGLESEVGKGSCFWFSLPGAVSPRKQLPSPEGQAVVGRAEQRIVVIEDDRATSQLIRTQLMAAGYAVEACLEPQRALQMVADLQPQAVTLDLLMKPVNGWEILLELKGDLRTKHIPVVVVTVVDQPGMGITLGADEFLVKPVQKEALLRAVQRCLAKRGGTLSARTILAVEDDTGTREIIAELLTAQGYAVTTAADGAQAREQVANTLPALVILDLMLPHVSGFELLADWRSNPRTADLPVFVLTSKDLTRDEETYLRAHAESLLRKNQSWEGDLLKQVSRVMPQRQRV